MKNRLMLCIALSALLCGALTAQSRISVQKKSTDKIDILVDGKLFTTFCHPADFEKPYLHPVIAPNGSEVTRGYPVATRKGERMDHPHHVGIWFNHGNVNGLDFWNNSFAVKDKTKFGHIQVESIKTTSSNDKGKLSYIAYWKDNDNYRLLKEETLLIFTGDENSRTIDRITKLQALGKEVVFTDNKEGMIAIRVDRAFETPGTGKQTFTDAHGNPTEVAPAAGNRGVNGVYYSSGGHVGGEVWSTRNDWVLLRGEKDGSLITFGFFDHPDNTGYPFHAHARGYGLFACNNLGSKVYNKKDPEITVTLKPGEKMTFHHRFYIESGKEVGSRKADAIFKAFSEEY